MNGQIWWFTARAGGVIAWALLAASTIWGLALSTRVTNGRPRPNWILDLHRFLGGLAVMFVGVHVVGLMADSYVHFGPVEILVPFTGSWHPFAVAWGILAAYLLLAIELTSVAKRRLPKRRGARCTSPASRCSSRPPSTASPPAPTGRTRGCCWR